MPPEDAMQKYIDVVTELYPTWADGSSVVSSNYVCNILDFSAGYYMYQCLLMFLSTILQKSKGGEGDASSAETKGPMGPVFSTFVYEETANET